jgi:YkoP domain
MFDDRVYRSLWGSTGRGRKLAQHCASGYERTRREVTLRDGTRIRGDLVGVLHLNNPRLTAIHLEGRGLLTVGLEFHRWLIAALGELARLAAVAGPLAQVRAFTAITISHRGLVRLGFRVEAAASPCRHSSPRTSVCCSPASTRPARSGRGETATAAPAASGSRARRSYVLRPSACRPAHGGPRSHGPRQGSYFSCRSGSYW